MFKSDAVSNEIGVFSIDQMHFSKRKKLFAFARWAHLASNGIASFESKMLDLLLGEQHVVGRVQVVVVA